MEAKHFDLYCSFFDNYNLTMMAPKENLVNKLWGGLRPKMTMNKIFVHDEKYAGESVKEKLYRIAEVCFEY